jgi:probable selenium-dependent hydroxylase accessory protein YqeC
MFALARELARDHKKVIATTTTKIALHEFSSSGCSVIVDGNPSWEADLAKGLREEGAVLVGEAVIGDRKIQGISPALCDGLFGAFRADYVIVEADGAAGHPVKAPAEHEPVIPSSATLVVAMMGLEALGRPVDDGLVFRLEAFRNLTGLRGGVTMGPKVLSPIFSSPGGLFKGSPAACRKIVFLNKLDLLQERREADLLARIILGDKSAGIGRTVIGSIQRGLYILAE